MGKKPDTRHKSVKNGTLKTFPGFLPPRSPIERESEFDLAWELKLFLQRLITASKKKGGKKQQRLQEQEQTLFNDLRRRTKKEQK